MKKERTFQSRIADEMIRYISFKRALKRSFETASTTLLRLDRFLHQLGEPAADLTAETFSQWCDTMQGRSPNTRQGRMRVVRNFCLYRQRSHPDCFVPDLNHLPEPHPLTEPYLFSDADVASLLSHSDSIADSVRSPLRGTATRLAIVLLYTTGLRRGELLRLTAEDYDPSKRTILIRTSKFYKSRLLPLPEDVAAELGRFLEAHRAIHPPLPVTARIDSVLPTGVML